MNPVSTSKRKFGAKGVRSLVESEWRYNLRMQSLTPGAARARILVNALWYGAFVLGLVVLALSLPGYARRVFDLTLEPIAAPEWYVMGVRALGALASIGTAVLSLALAALLFARKRDERMAFFVSFYLIGYGAAVGGPLETLDWLDPRMALIGLQVQTVIMTAPTMLLLGWFPNGQFVPGWMRYLVVASVPVALLASTTPASLWFENEAFLILVANIALIAMAGVGIYGQVLRYRHASTPLEQQQTKWFVLGMMLWLALFVVVTIPYLVLLNYPAGIKPWWAPLTNTAWWLMLMVIPLSLTIAVMRYRLWDVDLLINRALVYATLTGIVIALYVAIVGGLGMLLESNTNTLASLLATGVVAVLFQPLRERIQRNVNRLMYGERDEPYVVLAKLGQRLEATLEPDAVLPAIVETVAQALKLPYAAIELGAELGGLCIEHGTLAPSASRVAREREPGLMRIPLVYQTETVGTLLLAPRAMGEKFSGADQRLLGDFARQTATAVHTMRLALDLQRSRERIVTEREQERRRVRRDLHDGLGPALAGITLKLDAARNLLKRDPDATGQLLAELKTETQGALGDIRRLVYELRPPALDELGLAGALRQQVTRYDGANGLRVTLDAPETMPPLSAAVEVAAYRIATEALTNVVKHANGTRCTLRLRLEPQELRIEVQDDGEGIPDDRKMGIGLTSMRERAVELGGTLSVAATAGNGTRIMATLPL